MAALDFNLELAVFKASGDDEWRFEGIASTSSVDREGERITEKAIAGFKQQFAGVKVCRAASHEQAVIDIMSEVGEVDGVYGDDGTFGIKGTWDRTHPYTPWIVSKMSDREHDPQWKLSVGGAIPHDGWAYGVSADGRRVREINDMRLNHVLLCRADAAVNPDTAIAMAGKALPASDDLWEPVFKAMATATADDVVDDEWSEDDGNLEHPSGLPPADADCESAGKAVSEKPWSQVKRRGELPDSAYLYVKVVDGKKVRKFPVYEGDGGGGRGPLNRNAVAAAASRLGSTSPDVRAVVASKLRSIYRQHGWELPASLEGKAQEDTMSMGPDEKRSLLQRLAVVLAGEPDETAGDAAIDGADAAKAGEVGAEVPEDPGAVSKADVEALIAKGIADAVAPITAQLGAVAEAIEKAMAPAEEPAAEDPPVDETPVEDETPAEETPVEEPAVEKAADTPPVDVDAAIAKAVGPLSEKLDSLMTGLSGLLQKVDAPAPGVEEPAVEKAVPTVEPDGTLPIFAAIAQSDPAAARMLGETFDSVGRERLW